MQILCILYFCEVTPNLSLYNSAFWNYVQPPKVPSGCWFSVYGQRIIPVSKDISNASAWQLSWVVQLFNVIIDDILAIGICDDTYNMLVYRRTKAKDQVWPTISIGLPCHCPTPYTHGFVQAPCPALRGQLFRSLLPRRTPSINKQPKYFP